MDKEVMATLTKAGRLTTTPFDAKIKWTYLELWHHQGRRARRAPIMSSGMASTMWPNFLQRVPPEAEELMPSVTDSVKEMPAHCG